MSTEQPLTDDELSTVVEQLQNHGGFYTRRDIIAAAAATGSLGVLGALGIDTAEATHGVGRVGEPGDPIKAVYAGQLGDSSEPIHTLTTEDATVSNAPSSATDVARKSEIDNHDHAGDTINPATIQVDSTSALISVAASGAVTLSSGVATVDTALSAVDATFYLALGIDDPNANCKLTGRLFWDDTAGTYQIEIVEDGTNVGNPTVNYDILRVR